MVKDAKQPEKEFLRAVLHGVSGSGMLSADDGNLFGIRSRNPLSYASSWLYVLRTCRVNSEELGAKIVHSSVVVALGCHHDAVNICVLDHASPARAAQQLAALVSNLMQLASGMPVILKKIPDELAEYLQRDSGFVRAADRLSFWQLEDDALPETSIQLCGLCEAVAGGADDVRALRRQIRRFEREGIALIGMRSPSMSERVEALRQLSGSVTDKYEAYLAIVTEYHLRQPTRFPDLAVCRRRNAPSVSWPLYCGASWT